MAAHGVRNGFETVFVVVLLLGTAALTVAGCSGGGGGGGGPIGASAVPFVPNFFPTDARINHPAADDQVEEPKAACSGINVYVTWQNISNHTTNSNGDIFFNSSLDSGTTYGATDIRLDTDAASSANSFRPRIACDGNNVYVVWVDARGGSMHVRFNRSTDAGATWEPADIRVSQVTSATEIASLSVTCSGLDVNVAWEDDRNDIGGDHSVFYNRSTDGGLTWEATDRSLVAAGPAHNATNPVLASSGAFVYVAWQDNRNGTADIFAASSISGGPFAAEIRLDTNTGGLGPSINPAICCDGAIAYVAWEDRRALNSDIYCATTINGGGQWPSEARVDRGSTFNAREPKIACAGTNVYVAWVDNRLDTLADGVEDQAVFFNFSFSAGASFTLFDKQISEFENRTDLADLTIAASFSNVYVAWIDVRNDNGGLGEPNGQFHTEVFFDYSSDLGATWHLDRRMPSTAPATAASESPCFAINGIGVHLVWEDDRTSADPDAANEIRGNSSP